MNIILDYVGYLKNYNSIKAPVKLNMNSLKRNEHDDEARKKQAGEEKDEEINEKESVEDPLSIQSENENTLCEAMKMEDIKKEMKEEESVEDPLC